MKKIKEIREMDAAARAKELIELRREQFNLRMQHSTAQLGNTADLRRVRRDIARLKTVMNEKVK